MKVVELTVTPNSPPVRFARFALGGYELGGRMGAPSKRIFWIFVFVHKMLLIGDHAIRAHPTTVTWYATQDAT